MRKGDWMIAGVLLVVIAGLFVPRLLNDADREEAAVAKVMVNGELYRTVVLTGTDQEIEISTHRGYNLLRVSNQGIEMVEADCPDHLCIAFGHKHEIGDSIVCLPNRVFVEIIGASGEGGAVDAFVS